MDHEIFFLYCDCSEIIFLDVPSNDNTAEQAAGRVLRLSQERNFFFWILTLDHSYDQTIQVNTMNNMLSILAGLGLHQVDP